MLNRFLLSVGNTFCSFFNSSLAETMINHKFIVGEEPFEDLNPRRINNGTIEGIKIGWIPLKSMILYNDPVVYPPFRFVYCQISESPQCCNFCAKL